MNAGPDLLKLRQKMIEQARGAFDLSGIVLVSQWNDFSQLVISNHKLIVAESLRLKGGIDGFARWADNMYGGVLQGLVSDLIMTAKNKAGRLERLPQPRKAEVVFQVSPYEVSEMLAKQTLRLRIYSACRDLMHELIQEAAERSGAQDYRHAVPVASAAHAAFNIARIAHDTLRIRSLDELFEKAMVPIDDMKAQLLLRIFEQARLANLNSRSLSLAA